MAAKIDEKKVLEMLGMGLKPVNVAAALGCDPAYISQLLSDPQFREQVTVLRVEKCRAGAEMDEMLDNIEMQALKNLQRYMGFVNKPLELLKIAESVNKMRRRVQSEMQPAMQQANIVNIIMPSALVKNFTVSPQNEVIEVDGESLMTLPSADFARKVASGEFSPPKEIEHVQQLQKSGSS